ncbi:TMEM175 family protein [Furfurilactobacillus siliginis]|uniref:DUF1211 domain-containing membrane protein n=1 Tax=Furfurilactobacillus siliginis TaxID=348151 RepID=A0A0R2L4G3_9LACO|nr:TMEM175 family protein [Furfurilactobacillus siliginis]KRN96671.1 hypothetical protein IV55_GL001203 [Furfurilactobacillus siliginis]GEK29101.1 DUF1211 domain-containing membrane protein [Furfurilactobacillus siliginis]
MKKERFEAFTDAVIAIVLTILVLEIHLPDDNHSLSALVHIAPQFMAYVFTFLFISIMWINHHYLFLNVTEINNNTLWLNIFLLFWTSLLPATTAWIGTDIHARIPAILYAINIILYNVAFGLLRENVTKLNPAIEARRYLEWISFLINLFTLLLTYVYPPLVFAGITVDIIIWTIPHFIRQHH